MITDADIKRINELYHKSKSEGLTPDEKQEQVKLREAYIESVRANMRRQLNNIDVKRPDGSIVSLKEQAAQNLAKTLLYGTTEAYRFCAAHNVSTCWTDKPRLAKDISKYFAGIKADRVWI